MIAPLGGASSSNLVGLAQNRRQLQHFETVGLPHAGYEPAPKRRQLIWQLPIGR